MRVCSLGWENPLEKEMAAHPSILPGEPHGQRSLAGCLPQSCRKLDITEHTHRGAARWRFCIIKQGMGSGHELLCPFLISTCSPTWEPSEPSPFRILGRLHYTGTIDEVIGDGRLTQLLAPLPSLEAVGLKVATL